MPYKSEVTSSVDKRCIFQGLWYLFEGLTEHKCAKATGYKGQNQASSGVEQAQLFGDQVVGNDNRFKREHYLNNKQEENDVLAWKIETRKGVSRRNNEEELDNQDAQAYYDGVEHIKPERGLVHNVYKVCPHELFWNEG